MRDLGRESVGPHVADNGVEDGAGLITGLSGVGHGRFREVGWIAAAERPFSQGIKVRMIGLTCHPSGMRFLI